MGRNANVPPKPATGCGSAVERAPCGSQIGSLLPRPDRLSPSGRYGDATGLQAEASASLTEQQLADEITAENSQVVQLRAELFSTTEPGPEPEPEPEPVPVPEPEPEPQPEPEPEFVEGNGSVGSGSLMCDDSYFAELMDHRKVMGHHQREKREMEERSRAREEQAAIREAAAAAAITGALSSPRSLSPSPSLPAVGWERVYVRGGKYNGKHYWHQPSTGRSVWEMSPLP